MDTARIIELTKTALDRFGTYSFDDKGPHEVMDIDDISRKLRKLPVADATRIILEVSKSGEIAGGRGRSVAESLVYALEDWDDLFNEPDIGDLYG